MTGAPWSTACGSELVLSDKGGVEFRVPSCNVGAHVGIDLATHHEHHVRDPRGLRVLDREIEERRAVAVLDRRTVFVSLDAIDVTADLIARADEELGDGDGVVPFTPSPTPASDQPMNDEAPPPQN